MSHKHRRLNIVSLICILGIFIFIIIYALEHDPVGKLHHALNQGLVLSAISIPVTLLLFGIVYLISRRRRK